MSSLKGALGHVLAGAGAVDCRDHAAAGGFMPGTVGCEEVEPTIIDVVTTPRDQRMQVVLSNSFGFGGQLLLGFSGSGMGNR